MSCLHAACRLQLFLSRTWLESSKRSWASEGTRETHNGKFSREESGPGCPWSCGRKRNNMLSNWRSWEANTSMGETLEKHLEPERWFSGEGCLLLFQRTWVLIMRVSAYNCNCPRKFNALLQTIAHCVHVVQIHMQAKHLHIQNKRNSSALTGILKHKPTLSPSYW